MDLRIFVPMCDDPVKPETFREVENTCRENLDGPCLLPVIGLAEGHQGGGEVGGEQADSHQAILEFPGQTAHLQNHRLRRVWSWEDLSLISLLCGQVPSHD